MELGPGKVLGIAQDTKLVVKKVSFLISMRHISN